MHSVFIKPKTCPHCSTTQESWEYPNNPFTGPRWYIKKGYYKTKHDGQSVPRYQCKICKYLFSSRSQLPNYKQKKPKLNPIIFKWYSSGVTQRRIALNLGINRKTVARKFYYLARLAAKAHQYRIDCGQFKTNHIQFDEMETFEHTLAKPLSIAIAVDTYSGHIIETSVAQMKSHGRLSNIAMAKYGFRMDQRDAAREDVLLMIRKVKAEKGQTTIVTDKNTHYISDFARLLPDCKLLQMKRMPNTNLARRNENDCLWRINHTCSKLRHDLVRLARKTWATTKELWALQMHLDLYVAFNNGYKLF